MSDANINIRIREDGSVVVSANLRRLSDSARDAGNNTDRLNNSARNASGSLNRAGQSARTASTGFDGLIRKLRSTMTLMAAIAGTTISFGTVTHAMDAYTNLQNRLKLVAESQQGLNILTEKMFEISNRTRTSVLETSTAFSRFDMALKSVGRSQKESLQITETINKMITMSGLNAQESSAALLQLSQAFSKGKLDGDEFRTVAETMPMLMDALAKHFNTTRGGLLKLRKDGKITLDAMVAALKDSQAEVDAAFEKTKMSIGQSLEVAKNKWIKFWGELDAKHNISQKIADGILTIANNFGMLEHLAKPVMEMLAVWLGVRLVTALTTLSLTFKGLFPMFSLAAGALYILSNSGTKLDGTMRGLLISVTAVAAALAAWKFAPVVIAATSAAMSGLASLLAPIVGHLLMGTGAVRGLAAAFTLLKARALAATAAMLTNPLTWVAVAAAAVVALGVAWLTAKSNAEKFQDTLRSLREDLNTVDEKVKKTFNTIGAGRNVNIKLGIDDNGNIGNKAYLERLQAMKATANEVNTAMMLSSENSSAAIMENYRKIGQVFDEEQSKINRRYADGTREQIEQSVMLAERKKDLLQSTFDKLDDTLSRQKIISADEAKFRIKLEQDVYNTSISLMDARARYSIAKMKEIRAEAIRTASFLDFDKRLSNREETTLGILKNEVAKGTPSKDAIKWNAQMLKNMQMGMSQNDAEKKAYLELYGSAVDKGTYDGMNRFYKSKGGINEFKNSSYEEQKQILELLKTELVSRHASLDATKRDFSKGTPDKFEKTLGNQTLREAKELALLYSQLSKIHAGAKPPIGAGGLSTPALREYNPGVANNAAAIQAEMEKGKAKKAAKKVKNAADELAKETSDYVLKHAKGFQEYTGKCAHYLNDSLQKSIKGFKRVESGKDLAAAAVATGKYKYVKFDENYVPQIGDIQSMPSYTPLGKVHGHTAMYTKQHFVSDTKQGKFGDGRLGSFSEKHDKWLRQDAQRKQIKIARLIGSTEDNSEWNKLAESQYKDAEKFADKYKEVIYNLREQTNELKLQEPLRLSEQKSLELIHSLTKDSHELTKEQTDEIKQMTKELEAAAKAKFLLDGEKSRQKQLDAIRAVTFEEKVQLSLQERINAAIENRTPLNESEIEAERKRLEYAMWEEKVERSINDIWKSKRAAIEEVRAQLEAVNRLIGNGDMEGAFADKALTSAQQKAMQTNQAAGQTAYGNPMGNSWEEVLGAMDTARYQLLEGYTGTLNDLSGLFGNFFTTLQDGFANSIGAAIVQGKSLKETLTNVAQQGLQSLISGLVKLGLQWAINAAFGKTLMTAQSTMAKQQAATTGASIASSMASAAAMTSLATMGANSAGAMAGIMATSALTQGLSVMKGFSSGGYTGNGGINDVAGLVHGREFVMDADTTKRIGVQNLEALRNGNVSLSNGASVRGNSNSQQIVVNIENHAAGVTHDVSRDNEGRIRIIAREVAKEVVSQEAGNVVAAEIANPNSSVSRSMERNYSSGRSRE